MSPLGIRPDPRYRIVAEPRIVELLLLHGWAYELRTGERAQVARDAIAALDRCIELGLPFERAEGGERRFDPAEVVNFVKWIGLRNGDRLWDERFVATGRRLVGEFHGGDLAPDVPHPPADLGPQPFCVTFRREFNLDAWSPGARIRLRLPLPLEDDHLRNLTIVGASLPGANAGAAFAPGRLDVRLTVPRERVATLAVHVSFVAYPVIPEVHDTPLPRSEIELYTQPNEGIASISPRVRALAADLAGAAHEPREVVARFWNFLLDRLICGMVHYDELDIRYPTDHVLESGWYDCHLGSALLVALCRARGIAARIVAGYLLQETAPGYHYWCEFWMDGRGWVPVDSICADLSAMGRDAPWRDHFFGQLDYRMKTQCLPRLFTGSAAVRLPSAWHVVTVAEGAGVEIGFFATESGVFIHRDHVAVHRGAGPPGWGDWPRGSGSRLNAGPL